MSRFHPSSSTSSAPGAASSNPTINMSALRGRGYQVPQNSSTLPTSQFRPLHVPYVCDNQPEPSLEPSNLQPPSNRPGNLSSSTAFGPTSPKNTKKIQNKKQSPKNSFPLSSSASIASSSYYSDSCSYESIDWSALEIKPHPNAPKPYRSPTMYSDSTMEEYTSSSRGSGSSDLFPIISPCIRVDLLPGAQPHATTSIPFLSNLPFDPFPDHPTVFPSVSSSSAPLPQPQFKFAPTISSVTPSPTSTPQSFSAHHSLSLSPTRSISPAPLPQSKFSFNMRETPSPVTTQQSFSLHHSLSLSSSSSPSLPSPSIPTFHSHSRGSSVLAEDGSHPPSPQQPVVYEQIRLFRHAKKNSLTQWWSRLILEEELLISRANIVTPVRPFKESSKLIATSESDSEIVAQSPLSDPFICSPIPFVYSPSPYPQPISQKPRSKRSDRFHDERPCPVIPNVIPYTIPNSMPTVTYASSSTEDDSDTTNYPSSLDSYSEATPESEAIPSTTIATEQSWIHRNLKTIKTVATWTLIAAAIILPKILWKW
ncbi:hypothetical protein EAF04_005652 [Stromatinia cepivora]|nr:hypothetical protein EAF04_005652 [Stromatinia cepivora]